MFFSLQLVEVTFVQVVWGLTRFLCFLAGALLLLL